MVMGPTVCKVIFFFQFQKIESFSDLKTLFDRGLIGFSTIGKVRRTVLIPYHHYFMILQVNKESVVIVHLGRQGLYTRGVIKTVRFSDKEDSSFNFTSGVFVNIEPFPLNDTLIQTIKVRLEYMMSFKIIGYSLTSPKMFNCQSFVYFIKTGDKYCSEISTFICKFGILGKCMILVVDISTIFYNKFTYKCCTIELLIINIYRMLKRCLKRKLCTFLSFVYVLSKMFLHKC